ncbi:MAG: hypothetical protein C4334_09305 [Pyrinomonas sp.]
MPIWSVNPENSRERLASYGTGERPTSQNAEGNRTPSQRTVRLLIKASKANPASLLGERRPRLPQGAAFKNFESEWAQLGSSQFSPHCAGKMRLKKFELRIEINGVLTALCRRDAVHLAAQFN